MLTARKMPSTGHSRSPAKPRGQADQRKGGKGGEHRADVNLFQLDAAMHQGGGEEAMNRKPASMAPLIQVRRTATAAGPCSPAPSSSARGPQALHGHETAGHPETHRGIAPEMAAGKHLAHAGQLFRSRRSCRRCAHPARGTR